LVGRFLPCLCRLDDPRRLVEAVYARRVGPAYCARMVDPAPGGSRDRRDQRLWPRVRAALVPRSGAMKPPKPSLALALGLGCLADVAMIDGSLINPGVGPGPSVRVLMALVPMIPVGFMG